MHRTFIQSILEEASVVARINFGKATGLTKGEDNNQVITDTDIKIGKLLVAKVQ